MPLTIATWNINSVRLRMPIVERLLREHAPDILCLQETKCPDDLFPSAAFRGLGYEHIAFHGQKGYHGVATIARRPASWASAAGARARAARSASRAPAPILAAWPTSVIS